MKVNLLTEGKMARPKRRFVEGVVNDLKVVRVIERKAKNP